MNFYTNTYDLNNPTIQQVNVPTNTDYKIGLKFRRNGEMQNLNPNEVMLGTLSADAEKTNGYITFTKASNDNASFGQLDVVVDTRVPSDQEIQYSPIKTITAGYASVLAYLHNELSGLVGKHIYGDTVKFEASYDEVNWTELDYIVTDYIPVYLRTGTTKTHAWYPALYGDKKWHTPNEEGTSWVGGKAYDYIEIPETPWVIFQIPGLDPTFGPPTTNPPITEFPVKFRLQVKVGDPATGYTQTVKLNINEFKSQKGDLNPTPTEFETVNFAGTDGDGEAFSYDIVIK